MDVVLQIQARFERSPCQKVELTRQAEAGVLQGALRLAVDDLVYLEANPRAGLVRLLAPLGRGRGVVRDLSSTQGIIDCGRERVAFHLTSVVKAPVNMPLDAFLRPGDEVEFLGGSLPSGRSEISRLCNPTSCTSSTAWNQATAERDPKVSGVQAAVPYGHKAESVLLPRYMLNQDVDRTRPCLGILSKNLEFFYCTPYGQVGLPVALLLCIASR